MSEKTHITIEIVMAILIIVLSLLLGRSCTNQPEGTEVETKTDTVYSHSTDTLYIPKEKIKYVDKTVLDTIYITDTVFIREQKVYSDTFSTIWISGIEPELDSVRYYIPRDTIRIENTTTITKTKTKHLGQFVGIGAGVGYGVNIVPQPTFSPNVSISLIYGFGYTW